MSGEINKRLNEIMSQVDKDLSKHAYDFFVKTTPKKTGNARSKTRLANDEIQARYPYAQRLDQGYSKQAPQGMTQPTIEEMRRFIRNNIRK